MQSKGVSPGDLLAALSAQNVVMPSGTAKIGPLEYDVRTNSAPRTHRRVGHAAHQKGERRRYLCPRRGHRQQRLAAFQTNIVRQDGHRGVLHYRAQKRATHPP